MNFHIANPLKSGWLLMRAEKRNNWKKYWVVLDHTALHVHYFDSDEVDAKLLGVIILTPTSKIEIVDAFKRENLLSLRASDREYFLQGETRKEVESWRARILRKLNRKSELVSITEAQSSIKTPDTSSDTSSTKGENGDAQKRRSKKTPWTMEKSEKTGEMVYYNAETGERTTTLPVSTWKATKDKKSGKTYYYNMLTKDTSWKSPDLLDSNDKAKSTAATVGNGKPDLSAYPGWKAKYDEAKQKFYYFNKKEGITTWKHPDKLYKAEEENTSTAVMTEQKEAHRNEKGAAGAGDSSVDATTKSHAENASKEDEKESQKQEGVENDKEVRRKQEELADRPSASAIPVRDTLQDQKAEKSTLLQDSVAEKNEEKQETWQTIVDPTTGKQYYFNPATRETRWELPHKEVVKTPPKEVNVANPKSAEADETSKVDSPSNLESVGLPQTKAAVQAPTPVEGKSAAISPVSSGSTPETGSSAGKNDQISQDAIDQGWKEVHDEKTGNKYYYNIKTMETRWNLNELNGPSPPNPNSKASPAEPAVKNGVEVAAVDKGPDAAQTPVATPGETGKEAEWQELIDEKTKRKYYYNKVTRATKWSLDDVKTGKSASSAAGTNSSGTVSPMSDSSSATPVQTKIKEIDATEWTKMRKGSDCFLVNIFTGEKILDDENIVRITKKKATTEWRKVLDAKSGRDYYQNLTTNETAWVLPEGAKLIESSSGVSDAVKKESAEAAPQASTVDAAVDEDEEESAASKRFPNAWRRGYLYKEGGNWKTWRRRYFALEDFVLTYHKTPSTPELGRFVVPSYKCNSGKTTKKKFYFDLSHPNCRTYKFYAESEEDRQRWIEAFEHKALATGTAVDIAPRLAGANGGAKAKSKGASGDSIKIVHPEEARAKAAYRQNVKISSLSYKDKDPKLTKRSSRIFYSSSSQQKYSFEDIKSPKTGGTLEIQNQPVKSKGPPPPVPPRRDLKPATVSSSAVETSADGAAAKPDKVVQDSIEIGQSSSQKQEKAEGDWVKVFSEEHKRFYFHNTKTNETSWELPAAMDLVSTNVEEDDGKIEFNKRFLTLFLASTCKEMDWNEEMAVEACKHVLPFMAYHKLPEEEEELLNMLSEATEFRDESGVVDLDREQYRTDEIQDMITGLVDTVHDIISNKEKMTWRSQDETEYHAQVLRDLCKLMETDGNLIVGDHILAKDIAEWFAIEVERSELGSLNIEVKSSLIKIMGMLEDVTIFIENDVPKWLVTFLMSRYEESFATQTEEAFISSEIFFFTASLLTILFSQGVDLPIFAMQALLEAGMIEFFLSIIEKLKDVDSQVSNSCMFVILSYNLCFQNARETSGDLKQNDVVRTIYETLDKETHAFGELLLLLVNGEDPVGSESVLKLMRDLSMYEFEPLEGDGELFEYPLSFLYVNDIAVLADIIVLNLEDLNENDPLRVYYLQLCFGVLRNLDYDGSRLFDLMNILRMYVNREFSVLDVDIELSSELLERFEHLIDNFQE